MTSHTIVKSHPFGDYVYQAGQAMLPSEGWHFTRSSTRWAFIVKYWWPDTESYWVYSPAVFVSEDGGATWSGPLDEDNMPLYRANEFGTSGQAGQPLCFDYAPFAGTVSPDAISAIAMLANVGADQDDDGNVFYHYEYRDFDLEARTWGSPRDEFTATWLPNNNVIVGQPQFKTVGFSGRWSIIDGVTVWDPILFYSQITGGVLGAVVDGAIAVTGLDASDKGIENLIVGSRAWVLPYGAFDAGATGYLNGNLALIEGGDRLAVPVGSPPFDDDLTLYWSAAAASYGWSAITVPSTTNLPRNQNCQVVEDPDGNLVVFWTESDGGVHSVWRAVLQGGIAGGGWATPEKVWSADEDDNPDAANLGIQVFDLRAGVNTIEAGGGFDVEIFVTGNQPNVLLTFFVAPVGGGGRARNRYYGDGD